MIKIVNLIFFLLVASIAQAQVKLQLSLLADNKTYMVSMVAETTWTYPMNITGTAQVTVRYPSGKPFIVSNFKNLTPNVLWHDNAYLDAPQSARQYSFISFGLRSQGATGIPYESGREVPLFSFQNFEGCVGKVELVNNNEILLSGEDAKIYNIGNHWSTVGNPNEAYTGNLQSEVSCTVATTVADNKDKLFSSLMAYPVPTSNSLTLKINAKTDEVKKLNKIKFLNALGEEVLTQKVAIQSGEQELTIDVRSLKTGLNLFQLQGEGVASKNYKIIVIEK